MKLIHRELLTVALLFGITSLGCWVLTQGDAAITKEEVPMTLLIMSLSSVLFVLLHGTSAFLANKGKGV